MALKLNERYPGRFNNPTTSYPQGSFKNRTAPNAQDGSYLEQDWANDLLGFLGRLITVSGVTLNGNVDTALTSQYYDALRALTLQRTDPFGDIKADGAAAVSTALANLGLVKGIAGGISWTKINGVTEIWGRANIPVGGATITLPIAMPDTAYTIIATDADASIGQGAVIVGAQISTTQIHLHALKQGASVFVDASAGEVFFTVKSQVTV